MIQRDSHRDEERLAVARAVASEAGELLRSFSGDLAVTDKAPRDLVTAADFASQELIVRRLGAAFPGDPVVAEEGEWAVPTTGYWVVDPLDGTVNYSRGLPLYGVCLAFVDGDGQIRVGVVALPALGELYWARLGHGAFLNGRPLQAAATAAPERALVNVSDFNTGPEDQHVALNRLKLAAIAAASERCLRVKNLSSAGVELAWVAAGRLDAYLMVFCHFWDAAAGTLLVREAGGRVSDLTGCQVGADSRLVLASAAALHDPHAAVFAPHPPRLPG